MSRVSLGAHTDTRYTTARPRGVQYTPHTHAHTPYSRAHFSVSSAALSGSRAHTYPSGRAGPSSYTPKLDT